MNLVAAITNFWKFMSMFLIACCIGHALLGTMAVEVALGRCLIELITITVITIATIRGIKHIEHL